MVATFTNGKPRGRPFKKGQPKSAGRKKGSQNVHTRMVRWVIGEVARQIGGVDRLTAWVKEEPQNEFAFWTQIYPRLLPLQVQGAGARGEIEVNVKLSREEMMKRLIERACRRRCSGSTSRCSSSRPLIGQVRHQVRNSRRCASPTAMVKARG